MIGCGNGIFVSVILSIFSERELYMSLSVRLSSVCNVRAPYTGDWNFRKYFYAFWYAGYLL